MVHLIHNPEAELLKEQQQSKIAELQVQNEALQAELKKLEGAPAFGKPSQAAAWARSVAAAEASVMQLKVCRCCFCTSLPSIYVMTLPLTNICQHQPY